MKISKEFKIGFLVLIAGVILYVGFNFLKGVDFFSPVKTYYIEYSNIDGLTVSNPVVINGMTVGRVKELQLIPGKNTKIIVTIDVDDQIKINNHSTATLVSSDFLGGKMIVLQINEGSQNIESGGTIQGAAERSLTEELTERAKPVLDNLDTTITNFKTLMDPTDKESIKASIRNIESSTVVLNRMMLSNERTFNELGADLKTIVASIGETEKKLNPILEKMNVFADSLNTLHLANTLADVESAVANMNAIMEKVNSKDGTLGMLLNDKAAYENLNKSLKSMDSLMNHINTNPNHFFAPLGKSEKQIKKEKRKNK